MGFKDITIGEKLAKPTAARFIKSEKGTLGMEVSFQFENSSGSENYTPETLNWVGWLSEKAMDRTMETLVDVLGFNGNDEVDANSVLKDPNALNWSQQVSIVIEMEEYEGKNYPKIKWVNKLGGSGFAGLPPETIKAELGAVGFKAAFMAQKALTPPKTGQLGNLPLQKRETDVGF